MGKRSKKKQGKKDGKRGGGRKGPTLAEQADRYDLYQRSVQEAEVEVDFFDRVYRALHDRAPQVLREDFCGTFAVCLRVGEGRGPHGRRASTSTRSRWRGDARTTSSQLEPAAQERVTLVQGDVRAAREPKVDVLAAQNFSYWIFKTRDELRAYFEIARDNLAEGGIMVLDLFGGGECYVENEPDVRKYKGFRYRWEMDEFDPISHDVRHYIHFDFKDGSRLKRAFVYEWRFWTIPEVRELLAEAGFSSSTVYWEGEDEDGEGTDEYDAVERATCDPSWIAYVVAQR